MVDETKYSKLTQSAREALGDIVEEYKETILERAYDIAEERETATREISLRDILEAKVPRTNSKNVIDVEMRRKKFSILIVITGAFYALVGVVIYLIQNKTFQYGENLGLIVAVFGIFMLFCGFFANQFSLALFNKIANLKNLKSTDDYEIVKRWQIIEDLAKKNMSKTDKDEYKSQSVSFLIRYLSHKVAKNETEFLKIRKLLTVRNEIVHAGFTMDSVSRNELLDFSDELIYRLESAQSEKKNLNQELKVIKATYGTLNKSLDATAILNQLINNNRLEFVVNNDLVGDPDFGTVKQLNIIYKIGDLEKTEIHSEGDKVTIPPADA